MEKYFKVLVILLCVVIFLRYILPIIIGLFVALYYGLIG
ncbi:hypothetical protein [Peromfec virus RodF7_7]|uniref:Uncharacterized protein n=1 Tax=Peromfec virus RodF7_7 TaxID=2929355 RepID=A0A976N2S5_9VIRU|nr:hypothetical protein [Peromfec virus RodF7_7]